MAGPLSPLPFDKEHEILDAIQLADKPLYIRSKGSEVHVGPKIIFEIQNKNDIDKLQPLITSLGQSSSDSSLNRIITEGKEKPSISNTSSMNDNQFKSDMINTSQKSTANCVKVVADSTMPVDESKISSPDSANSDGSLLLTPDFFQRFENVKITDIPSRFSFKTETTTDCTTSSNFSLPLYAESKQLKSMPIQSAQANQYYDEMSSVLHKQGSITSAQNQYPHNLQHRKTICKDNSYFIQESLAHVSAENIPNTSARNHFDYSSCHHVSNTIDNTVSSMPYGSQNCAPPHMLDNIPRVRIIDQFSIKHNKNETNNYRKLLDRNYMEERNFMLGIDPGVFYDTPHGILVEVKNGCQYEIMLANNNKEACDVDLFVDTKLVYKVRLHAYEKTSLDGPKYNEKKFVYLRACDAPPEGGIINKHERNGQIKAVFMPEISDQLEEKRRAWTIDSGALCSQFLSQTVNNITGPGNQESLYASSPPEVAGYTKYRTASLCSGATALQGRQREKCFEHAEYIKVDKNRMVILHLRVVARSDDQSRPNTNEPITPLITKMPPPLPF